MLPHEEIKRANPVFNVFSCQVLCVEKVALLKKNGDAESESFMVVSTPGIAVFKEVRWRPLHQQVIISYADIHKMIIKKNLIVIETSDDRKISFRSLNQMRIAARIFAIRTALFDPADVPYEMEIDEDCQSLFDKNFFIYQTSSYLMDRFLSNVMKTKTGVDSAQLDKVCRFLMQIKTTLEVNKALMDLSYTNSIAVAISYDKNITELKVKDLSLSSIMPFMTTILANAQGIKRVMFIGVNFDSTTPEYVNMMKTTTKFKADEWIFENCNLGAGFPPFFNAFIKYQAQIKILTLNMCVFPIDVFESFSQTMFFAKCFHFLEALWISDVRFPTEVMSFLLQLFGCDWLLKNQRLHTLAVIDCCIDLDMLFEHMWRFNTGIMTVNFSGNTFVHPPTENLSKALSSQMNLVLNGVGFADNALPKLLQALASHSGTSLRLDLSGVSLRRNEWELLEEALPNIVLPTLTELVWNRNSITHDNVHQFIQFIKNQPKLTELSISDCISTDEAQDVLVAFVDYLKMCKLEAFTIASTNPNTALGPILTPLLEHILQRYTLKMLDISGQNIGDAGLVRVTQIMPLAMQEFRFEGNSISSADAFVQIMHYLLERQLKMLTWPEKDIKPALLNAPVGQRGDLFMRIEAVRRQYIRQYGKLDDGDSAVALNTIMKYVSVINPEAMKEQRVRRSSSKVSAFEWEDAAESTVEFRIRDEQMEAILSECAWDEKKDPINTMYKKLANDYGFQGLCKRLKTG